MLSFLYSLVCFVLPNTVWQFFNGKKIKGNKNSVRHIVWTYIFMLYCALAVHIAQIGSIWDFIYYKVIPANINLVLFEGDDVITYLLNIIMFAPLGFLLPFIWKNFRKLWIVTLTGLSFSLLIEIFQLFNRRLSDINDLLMNVIGAILGYLIWLGFNKIFPKIGKKSIKISKMEPVIYVVLGVIFVFSLYNWRLLENINDSTVLDSGTHLSTSNNSSSDNSISNNVVLITFTDGQSETKTYEELVKTYKENSDSFNKKYIGAGIKLCDKCINLGMSGDNGIVRKSLYLKEGWRLKYPHDQIKLPDTEINTWTVDVNTYISEVVEYEQGKPCIELGDYDNRGPIKTTINISYNN